jgi:hypothetical protein
MDPFKSQCSYPFFDQLLCAAQITDVTVVPTRDLSAPYPLACVSCSFSLYSTIGPFPQDLERFTSGRETLVPLWFAIRLDQDGKASVRCPPWLTVDNIRAARARELETSGDVLPPIHPQYFEIAKTLLQTCV